MEDYGTLGVSWAQGYKGDEISHVDSDSICYACGNCIKFMDIANNTESSFQTAGNGIKSLATFPSQSVFAVAEMGLNPRIFIYRYPSFEVVSTLEGGAELEYNGLVFSTSGSLIAACSGLPDFTLSVWNWSTGELKCKEKLLSEEHVTSLLFNPLNQHQISLVGPNKATIWTLQECNDISTLRSKKINLPTSDGIVLRDDEDTMCRSATRGGTFIAVPASAKAGLYGETVKNFQPPEFRRSRLTPKSQCWTSRGEVLIGCDEGSLFRVDAESGSVTVVLGSSSDRIIKGGVVPGMFQSIALNAHGILAGGYDQNVRLITIDNNGVKIEKVWKGSSPITTISFSPKNFQTLIYGTSAGSIHQFCTTEHRGSLISKSHTGQFVGVSFGDGGRVCATCREDGELQVWDGETGFLLSSLSLKMRVTSIAFCPSSPVIAVGTWTGHICYVDASAALHEEDGEMRQVYSIRMHHQPVSFLMYDGLGECLLSASNKENYVFVINAKPSANFNCIGYVDCLSSVRNLSIQQQGKISNVVAVVAPQEQTHPDSPSDGIVVFTLSHDVLNDPTKKHFQSLRHNFKDHSVKCHRFRLSVPVDSAVVINLGDNAEVAALSIKSKKLLKFELPWHHTHSDSKEPTPLPCSPESEHPAHQLDGGIIALSPHGKWLASSSKDGSIIVRDLHNWDSCVTIVGHSYMEGGTKSLAFSPDAKQIVSIGANDGSFICYSWNFTDKGSIAATAAVEFARTRNMHLRSTIEPECDALYEMEEIVVAPMEQRAVSVASTATDGEDATEVAAVAKEEAKLHTPDATEQSRPASNVESDPPITPVPLADLSWLDHRVAMAVKAENAKYDEAKKILRSNIKDLRKTILGMMKNNDRLPELEQLRHDEYNLDAEEQKRMQAEQDKEVQNVREEIRMENLAQRYLAYLIQKECWDDMVAKGRALKTFNMNVVVNNYPTRAVTAQEEALLKKITEMRQIEIAESAVRKSVVEAVASKTSNTGDEEEEEEDEKIVGLALHGSLGPKYGGDSDLFYSQFDLHTREEKIAQLILIKDALRRIKEAFNDSFTAVYRNKEQELARIKERNVRIRAIMKDLDMDSCGVSDLELDQDEMPEKAFVVSDDEVTVERVLSEEQQREKEDQEKMEEERRAAEKGDNKRERALVDMMGGVLEVKKEDLLKQDLPPPDFVEEKLEKDWTDEERKKYKEFEKKLKDLQEEREKYRKNLENELKKLQTINLEGMAAFDEALNQLFNKKVKTEMVINQEELKVLRLTSSIMMDDNVSTHERHLNYLFELKNRFQVSSSKLEIEIRKKVEDFREVYDSIVAEDKMLDRGFKREFSDVPLSISDQLYKLFRRRPRIQRNRVVEEKSTSLDPYGAFDKNIMAASHAADRDATLVALVELDSEVNMPEGVDAPLWERLCDARRAKVENELKVKHTAMTLAEMTQYLQHRQEENDKLSRDIDEIARQQAKLCDDAMRNNLNLEVQLLLKQGQVEVPCGQYIPDYSDSILVHRGVVEDLNGTIRTLGESKVAAMTESKDFKKGIHQLEWERKRMIMQMEDLHNRARHIQMLKLTKELQAFLNEDNQSAKQAKQMAVLEQTLALQDKQLDKNISQKDAITSQLIRKIRMKEHENKELDKVLEELHVSVSERQNIVDVNALERTKNTADKRLHGIVQRRKLVDLAKAQAQEVAVLRAEVERLRMKTFPALVQVER